MNLSLQAMILKEEQITGWCDIVNGEYCNTSSIYLQFMDFMMPWTFANARNTNLAFTKDILQFAWDIYLYFISEKCISLGE